MTTACNGEISLTKNSQIMPNEDVKRGLKASFIALPELPASFIKANANPRLPRLLDAEQSIPSKKETIAKMKASLLPPPASQSLKLLGAMRSPGAPSLGGMKRISSKVSISEMVEAWEIPLAEDDDEGPLPAPTKTLIAVKKEQLPSLRPRHVRSGNEEVGCCAAGLKRAIRFVFFGF